jgi:hypothetical protein
LFKVGSNPGVDRVDRDVTVIIGYHGGSGGLHGCSRGLHGR